MPFEFSEKFKFRPNSKTTLWHSSNVFSNVWKSTSSSKESWNPHQNWPTNGDNIAIRMSKPLMRQSFIYVQDAVCDKKTKQNKTKTLDFCFSRRHAAADLHQTLHEDNVRAIFVPSWPLVSDKLAYLNVPNKRKNCVINNKRAAVAVVISLRTTRHCCYVDWRPWLSVWNVRARRHFTWRCSSARTPPCFKSTTRDCRRIRSITSPSDRWASSARCCRLSSSVDNAPLSPSPTSVFFTLCSLRTSVQLLITQKS